MRPAPIHETLDHAKSAPPGLEVVNLDMAEMVILTFPIASPKKEKRARLSLAEREVAMRVLQGQSNAAIAEARGTSARTVANQIASVFRKLKVGSRAELAATSALLGR